MKKKLLFLFFVSVPFVMFADTVSFPDQGHCVAWKTNKRLFMLKKESPEGINCSIQTSIEKGTSVYRFQGIFPIKGFNSGNESRDEHIRELLEENIQENLFYISEYISLTEWSRKKNSNFELKGILKRGNKPYNITFTIRKEMKDGIAFWLGVAKTSFTAMGMEPPSVAGGAIAKVNDELELHFQFREDKIINFPK